MATCPHCQTEYPDGVTTCEKDGAELVDSAIMAAADRDIESGEQIGEYRVESKLGQGGFGAVYRVVHPLIGKTAAIKVLSRRFSSDPEMVSRFVAEARAVNRIQNKNIIDIFAFGALPDGRQYYVMELLDGVTLEQYLEERGYLSPEEAIPILLGIARALDAAHASGIAHRDLKPDNVFLAFDEDRGLWPKLLDFGIAKLMGDDIGGEHKTRTGVPLGTPYYMSPEQCRGMSVDHRTDIYSFGVLCYQLLSGTLPFTGDSFMDVMMKHVGEELPPLSTRSQALTAAFDVPIAHMMAKDPGKRPTSMLAALTELTEAARAAGHDVEIPTRGALAQSGQRTPMRQLTPGQFAALESADTLAQATTATGDTLANTAAGTKSRRAWPLALGGALIAAVALAIGLSAAHRPVAAERPSPSATAQPPAPSSVAAPATSVVPAASTAAPAPPAPPAQIKLSVQSVPKHVEVYLGGRKLGTAPGPLMLDRGKEPLELELRADGYVPRKLKFTPTANGVISATLQKVVHHASAAAGKKKSKTPADLEF